ncbi:MULTISPECIES: hypothetical protein [Streptomyces]|uniref:hypothetical protein n=1 Tax=Streptomyces TaxID=1883 RepID=UPI0033B41262
MGEGDRNGDVSGPTTPYACGDLGGLQDADGLRNLYRNTQRNTSLNIHRNPGPYSVG